MQRLAVIPSLGNTFIREAIEEVHVPGAMSAIKPINRPASTLRTNIVADTKKL